LRGPRAIAAGAFVNGAAQRFSESPGAARLNAVEIKAGEILQLGVYPKGEYACDTTVVELEIVEQGGAKRTWNVTGEVVPSLVDGNSPHADAAGNAGVWHFYEVPDVSAGPPVPADSVLDKWLATVEGANDAADVLKSAAVVRDALVAADTRVQDLKKAGKDALALTGAEAKLYQDLTNPRGGFWAAARADDNNLPQPARESIAKMLAEAA